MHSRPKKCSWNKGRELRTERNCPKPFNRRMNMYMDERFGAWQSGNQAEKGSVEFKIFFPDRNMDPAQYCEKPGRPTYGDPQIESIQVAGDFMSQLQLRDWDLNSAPRMTVQNHPKGRVWSWTSPDELKAGFYEYKYYVTFRNGESRWVGDPCARYGGTANQNSAFVIGGSRADENRIKPLEKRKPLRDQVVYELMIDDFTDEYRGFRAPLDAIRDRLDYLGNELGITTVLFMPWTAWPGEGFNWGYTPHQYFSVEYRYTNALNAPAEKLSWLKKLVNACHERGIHVIMDGVFNHVGDEHASGDTAMGFPYRWLYQDQNDCPYSGVFGGCFPGLLDLDYNNGCTRHFILDVCRYWMDEFGIDGIRFDNTVNFHVYGTDAGLTDLLRGIRRHANDPDFSLTLEHLNKYAVDTAKYVGATSYWNDELFRQTFNALWDGHPGPDFLRALNCNAGLDPDQVATVYLGNHDHSHVAWRAGARNNRGAMEWYRLQPYYIALMTMPGCPMLQNGQEFCEDYWIMEDDSGTGRRVQPRPLRWSFAHDQIGKTMRGTLSGLIELRRKYKALRSDDIYPDRQDSWQTRFNNDGYGVDSERGLVIYHRWGFSEDGALQRFIIVLNFSGHETTVDIPFSENGHWQDLLNNRSFQIRDCLLPGMPVESYWGHVYYQS